METCKVHISDIKDHILPLGFHDKIEAEISGHLMPFSAKFCDSDHMVVFFPGAHDAAQPKPKFQRQKYFDRLDCNCVSLFDPTLFLDPNLMLGWFQGGGETPHFERVHELIISLLVARSIAPENLILFSTSAGGLPAIKVSEKIPEASVFIGNPQTDVMRYYKPSVDRLVEAICPGNLLSDLHRKNMSVIGTDSKAKIHYAQNIQDLFHVKSHMEPFRRVRQDINFIIYDHPSGHNPMPPDVEISVIQSIISGDDPRHAYKKFLIP